MPATRTAAGSPPGHQPVPEDGRGLAQVWPGPSGLDAETGEGFWCRFGDVIDDRIAEVVDELLDQRSATRPPSRLPHMVAAVCLILALTASVLLRHDPLAAWMIWPSAATICLASICATRTRR